MSIVDDLPGRESLSTVWQGTIAKAPVDELGTVEVLIPAFDNVHRFGPCKWSRLAQDVGFATSFDTSWHNVGDPGEPAFENSWVNFDTRVAKFRKLSNGMVILQGVIRDGTVSGAAPAFTLPVGYRPAAPHDQAFLVHSASTTGVAQVGPSGGVFVIGGSNSWVYLNAMQFFAGPDLSLNASGNVELPQRGDPCIVVFDEDNRPYVIGWWPT